MPYLRSFLASSCLFLSVLPAGAQQSIPAWVPISKAPPPVTTPAPQDQQAVSVLNQALAVAGGPDAVKAVTDYSASGKITYHADPEIVVDTTVQALGTESFRMDAFLSQGTRAVATKGGITSRKAENGKLSEPPQAGTAVPSSDAFPYQSPLFPGSLFFPYGQILVVLGNPLYNIAYKGIAEVDGHSVHQIHIQRVSPGVLTSHDPMAEFHTRDFFIDAMTLQILATQDLVPKHTVHRVQYADYKLTNNVLVPFTVSEQLGGQRTWSMSVTQFTFNSGLQDSAFSIQ